MSLTIKQYAALIIITVIIIGLLQWEFKNDSYPIEAIEFYRLDDVQKNKNLQSAINGLVAPRKIQDDYQWGTNKWEYYKGVSKEQYSALQFRRLDLIFKGENPPELAFKNMEVAYVDSPSHHVCWQPKGEKITNNCITEGEISEVLSKNKIILNRYEKMINNYQFDYNQVLNLHQSSNEISKQFSIKIWLKYQSMSMKEFETIIKFLLFWRTVVDQSLLDLVSFQAALINYGVALNLFHETGLLYPKIFDLYQKSNNGFSVNPIDQTLFDRLAIAEFYFLDDTICLSKVFGYKNTYCQLNENIFNLTYKPGRTINLMFSTRHHLFHCDNPRNSRFNDIDINSPAFQLNALVRPGNYQGRLYAFGAYFKSHLLCDAVKYYRLKNEAFGLYQLYHKIKGLSLSADQIDELLLLDPEFFRIPSSNRYYQWNTKKQQIELKHIGDTKNTALSLPL